ncbi:MAG: hypothetical protein HC866_06945 [Leptolyngbyaceae cyanobacterium RU_5_1]|nr:hypothetical protein [Leptolyngbyaceae cyanobacterium RU_5_1]
MEICHDNLISTAIARLSSLCQGFQVKRFLAIALVGFLVLTTNIDPGNNKALAEKVRDRVHQDGGQRPKTTGEWLNEADQDVPLGERIRDIAEDSAEAFKEFGSGYTEGAQKTARDVRDNAAQAGQDLSNRVR